MKAACAVAVVLVVFAVGILLGVTWEKNNEPGQLRVTISSPRSPGGGWGTP